MKKSSKGTPKGEPLDDEMLDELTALVLERGEAEAAEITGINRGTLARAVARLSLYAGSHALISLGLHRARQNTKGA